MLDLEKIISMLNTLKLNKQKPMHTHIQIELDSLKYPWLQEYMKTKDIQSYPDIDIEDFKKWFEDKLIEHEIESFITAGNEKIYLQEVSR